MKESRLIEPIYQDFYICDFPGCKKETHAHGLIDNPYWSSYNGRVFCKNHFFLGKFLINQGEEKIWVLHNVENSDKVVGEIIDILPKGNYNVQWYFDGKKLSDPTEPYHASVLTLLPFKI